MLNSLRRKASSKQQKWKWAKDIAVAAASGGHWGPGSILMVIESATTLTDMFVAERAIEQIFREYPELKKSYDSDSAFAEIQAMKDKFIVAGKPKRMPELGKRRHARVRQRDSKFDADDGDDFIFRDLTADECYRSFIKGTNRVCETDDGWIHFWYEPEK